MNELLFLGEVNPKRKFEHEKIENEVIIRISNCQKTEEKKSKNHHVFIFGSNM